MITLYDDWLLRRERLMGASDDPFAEVQIRVLDYLLIRYADDPAVRQPALFPLDGNTCFNSRVILVNRHLGCRDVGEAQSRAHRILSNIANINPQESIGAPGSNIPSRRWNFSLCSLQRPDLGNWYKELFFDNWMRSFFSRCRTELQHADTLPEPAISYLVKIALTPDRSTVRYSASALDILDVCENDSLVPIWWNCGLQTNRPPWVVERVVAYLMKRRARVAKQFRSELASTRQGDRIRAARVLGMFGSLDDISLLQDLLALPDLKEQSDERDAYVSAMNDLAGQPVPQINEPQIAPGS
jgi:hypothetical protein